MANSFNKHFKNIATWTFESMILVAMWALSPKKKKKTTRKERKAGMG
jgi:hypothetical protein